MGTDVRPLIDWRGCVSGSPPVSDLFASWSQRWIGRSLASIVDDNGRATLPLTVSYGEHYDLRMEAPITTERTIAAPVERVWRAITDPAQMPRWFFETIADFNAEVGFETRFSVNNGVRDYVHLWRVTEVIPNKRLAYDWLHPPFTGEGVLVWELDTTPDGTKLKISHRGVETFPQDDPAFSRQAGIEGWAYFADRLKAFVEKQ
jgi:uncharacterized protein YndB with AHSA1/START domain